MKRFIFWVVSLLAMGLCTGVVYAQTTNLQWAKSAGGARSDQAVDIALDPREPLSTPKNSAIIGFFEGTTTLGSTPLSSVGGRDILVAKYDDAGNVLWAKRFGGSADDYGRSIVIDYLGNLYIAGEFFSSSISFDAAPLSNGSASGKSDIFIVKLNETNGEVIWAKKAGGADVDLAHGVTVDRVGNVLLAGRFKSTATFGDTTITSAGDDDIFVARYTTSGSLVWVRKAGGAGTDRGFDIAADKDLDEFDDDFGNIYVTGEFSGTADFSPTPGTFRVTSEGSTDVFVVKYDSSGNVKWLAKGGGAGADRGVGIGVGGSGLGGETPKDDYVIVTGTFAGTATFGTSTTLESAGDDDIFIANYSSIDGSLQKALQSGGASKDFVTNISVNAYGTSFITGFFQDSIVIRGFSLQSQDEFVSTTLKSAGSEDIFLAKYNREFHLLAALRAGGVSSDISNSVASNTAGEVRLTGTYRGTTVFDSPTRPMTLPNQGIEDIFVARYSSPQSAKSEPTTIVAEAIFSTKIKVTWTDSYDNELEFEIFRSNLTNPSEPRERFRVAPNVTMYLDTTVTSETQYAYVVRVNTIDTGVSSDGEEIHTLAGPTDCRASAITLDSVTIAWTDKSQKEIGYKIARSTKTLDASFQVIDSTKGNPDVGSLSYTDKKGVLPDTIYFYRIWAYNNDNVKAKSVSDYCIFSVQIPSPCKDISALKDWNLVSAPWVAADMSKRSLFPTAISEASGYAGGYVTAATLENGKGYWLKFGQSQNVHICGAVVGSNTIPVSAGWNIIGPYDRNVAVSGITSTPAGIISSSFSGYNAGYQTATTLEAGKGYWVKVSQNGQLNLPSGVAEKIVAATPADETIPNDWGKIIIEDRTGKISTLYAAREETNLNRYELPPAPPSGAFDVRFSSQRYVEHLDFRGRELRINAADYPLKLRVQGLDLRLTDSVTGKLLNTTLRRGDAIEIHTPIAAIKIEPAPVAEKPRAYELQQNYPNPFNPTTIIKFSLPEAGKVRLSFYNLLGKKLADLLDEYREAGFYQMEFNAKDYPSGIYFYKLESGQFADLKKMIILR